jgi:Ca2+-binding EF-hand superfamily protein
LFDQFDKDKNHRFTKNEFPRVLKALINMVGGEEPASDDIEDLFNLLDVNGDETIDRKEFTSLLTTFFRLLD